MASKPFQRVSLRAVNTITSQNWLARSARLCKWNPTFLSNKALLVVNLTRAAYDKTIHPG